MTSRYLRQIALSILVGALAGFAASIFLILLQWATTAREHYPWIIWFLPLAGLAIGLAYHRYGHQVTAGSNLILDEIHDPKNKVPLRMALMILFSTVLTHLFGGSAGREGTVVQMGGSLADQVASFFRVGAEDRRALLMAGLGAGFGSAISAPWAGMMFGMEVIHVGNLRFNAWLECLVASFVGYAVTVFMKVPHSLSPFLPISSYDVYTIVVVIGFGCICGLAAWAFMSLTHRINDMFQRFVHYSPLRPMIGGILLVLLYYLEGSYLYTGLGIRTIQESAVIVSAWYVPLLKAFFTALTLGSGFKGGEFIPLVFIGATLGSVLSVSFHVGTPLLAALGFCAVFAGAANTPIACTLMAMEIFGPEIGVYALLACFFSYYCSGQSGIYASQKLVRDKHHHFKVVWKFLKRHGDESK